MGRISHHLKGKDYKKTHQRKLDEQRALYLERREKEIQEEKQKKNIEEAAKPFKSDWRNTLTESEWYAIAGSGPTNSVSQTFAYGDPASGIEVTLSGLGGVEAHPSTVTIDGETYDAPTYNQLAMQGYAKPLGFDVNRRTDFQDVNPYLDASQEFAQKVGADYMMNARVQQTIRQEVETDIAKIAAKFDSSLIENMGQNIKLAVEAIMNGQQPPLVAPPDPPFTGMSHEQMVDETNKVNDKYNKLLEPLQKELDSYAGQLAPAGLVAKINALVEKQSQETNALYEKNLKDNQEYGDLLAKRADEWGKFVNAIEDYRKGFNLKSPSQEVAQVASTDFGDKVEMITTSARAFVDYLTSNVKVIDRKYLGKRYMDYFFQNIVFEDGKSYANDGIIGSADSVPVYNPKTNNLTLRTYFDFDNNWEVLQKSGYTKDNPEMYAKFEPRLLGQIPGFDYWRDANVDPLGPLGAPAGILASLAISASKFTGIGGKSTPIVIKFTPQELRKKNKKQYDRLVDMGVIPKNVKESTTWNRTKKHLKGA